MVIEQKHLTYVGVDEFRLRIPNLVTVTNVLP